MAHLCLSSEAKFISLLPLVLNLKSLYIPDFVFCSFIFCNSEFLELLSSVIPPFSAVLFELREANFKSVLLYFDNHSVSWFCIVQLCILELLAVFRNPSLALVATALFERSGQIPKGGTATFRACITFTMNRVKVQPKSTQVTFWNLGMVSYLVIFGLSHFWYFRLLVICSCCSY